MQRELPSRRKAGRSGDLAASASRNTLHGHRLATHRAKVGPAGARHRPENRQVDLRSVQAGRRQHRVDAGPFQRQRRVAVEQPLLKQSTGSKPTSPPLAIPRNNAPVSSVKRSGTRPQLGRREMLFQSEQEQVPSSAAPVDGTLASQCVCRRGGDTEGCGTAQKLAPAPFMQIACLLCVPGCCRALRRLFLPADPLAGRGPGTEDHRAAVAPGPRTFIHDDYRGENMFFGPDVRGGVAAGVAAGRTIRRFSSRTTRTGRRDSPCPRRTGSTWTPLSTDRDSSGMRP